ncbi:YqiA/YcfP family alpha/beta fold hydrolase [Psychromonas hadalis]|uniref:YqiA/YcfP family alpha/beta fold hydrolase n=1 Tax=Psychromonas hadalis TaxID=211669 RepID=UPI0003B742AA|nr:YqiA/YcfP family alpha/beta fold hydrolase [Psychromonas hadalis]
MTKVLLSLHGFHSSPASLKAQQMAVYLTKHHPEITFICPQLPCLPEQMWHLIESIFDTHKDDDIAIVGSSLGGYLATKVADIYKTRIIVVNPAVTPYLLLQIYAGEQTHPYTGQKYLIDDNYMAELKALDVKNVSLTAHCWVLLQQGDEVLDYQQALHKYQGCKITCETGGDHSFVEFERFIPDIIKFLFYF